MVLASGCIAEMRPRVLDAVNAAALAVSTAALAWDACQTAGVAADRWSRGRSEVGLAAGMIGARPSPGEVVTYNVGVAVVNGLVWMLAPRKWRSAAPAALTAVQTVTIIHNLGTSSSCNPLR